jgi:hypothetical protein
MHIRRFERGQHLFNFTLLLGIVGLLLFHKLRSLLDTEFILSLLGYDFLNISVSYVHACVHFARNFSSIWDKLIQHHCKTLTYDAIFLLTF